MNIYIIGNKWPFFFFFAYQIRPLIGYYWYYWFKAESMFYNILFIIFIYIYIKKSLQKFAARGNDPLCCRPKYVISDRGEKWNAINKVLQLLDYAKRDIE